MASARVIFSNILFLASGFCRGQSDIAPFTESHFRAGLVLTAGTHVLRAGFCFNVFFTAGPVQFNTEARTYWNWRNLGPPLRYSELVVSQAVMYCFGASDQAVNPFPGILSHQSGRRYSVGYAYNAWFNRVGTTQQTGTVGFNAFNWTLISENDIYARPALDRFRSGGLMVRFRHADVMEAAVLCKIWTGQYKGKIMVDSIPQFKNHCYMNPVGGKYTQYSHGILAAEARFLLPYDQVLGGSAGIDAEQARNVLQNQLMHNLRFVPQKLLKRKNCHLPMTDDDGGPFLYGPGQAIRKPRPYFEVSSNPGIFY